MVKLLLGLFDLPAPLCRSTTRADNQFNQESARCRSLLPSNRPPHSCGIIGVHMLRAHYSCAALASNVYHCDSLLRVMLRGPAALIAEVLVAPTIIATPAPDINNDTGFAALATMVRHRRQCGCRPASGLDRQSDRCAGRCARFHPHSCVASHRFSVLSAGVATPVHASSLSVLRSAATREPYNAALACKWLQSPR